MYPNPGAYRLYLFYSGATSFFFALIFTVMGVYRVQEAGLNPLQLVLVGTVLEVTYFLFNVPTGVVADTYSRRLSVIIGVFLFGVGFVLEGLVPVFRAILLAQVIEAFAYTFVEGALEAWIVDEVGEENAGPVFLRGGQVGGIAGFVGIFASVGFASLSLSLPIVLGGALFVLLGAFLILTMREPAFHRPERTEQQGVRARATTALRDMQGTVHGGAVVMRRRPLALTVLLVAAVFGGFSEGYDRLWEAHFLRNIGLPRVGAFEPVVWFGIISAGSTLLGVGAAEVARRRVNARNSADVVRALLAFNTLLVIGVVGFAQARGFGYALTAFWLSGTMRQLQYPVYGAWLNQNLDSRVRATVLSMSSQADALGQFSVGPVLGALGTAFGLRTALTAAGLVLSPALLLYGHALRKGKQTVAGSEPVLAASEQ